MAKSVLQYRITRQRAFPALLKKKWTVREYIQSPRLFRTRYLYRFRDGVCCPRQCSTFLIAHTKPLLTKTTRDKIPGIKLLAQNYIVSPVNTQGGLLQQGSASANSDQKHSADSRGCTYNAATARTYAISANTKEA